MATGSSLVKQSAPSLLYTISKQQRREAAAGKIDGTVPCQMLRAIRLFLVVIKSRRAAVSRPCILAGRISLVGNRRSFTLYHSRSLAGLSIAIDWHLLQSCTSRTLLDG